MVLYGRRDPAASDMRGVALTAGTRSTRIAGSHPHPSDRSLNGLRRKT